MSHWGSFFFLGQFGISASRDCLWPLVPLVGLETQGIVFADFFSLHGPKEPAPAQARPSVITVRVVRSGISTIFFLLLCWAESSPVWSDTPPDFDGPNRWDVFDPTIGTTLLCPHKGPLVDLRFLLHRDVFVALFGFPQVFLLFWNLAHPVPQVSFFLALYAARVWRFREAVPTCP